MSRKRGEWLRLMGSAEVVEFLRLKHRARLGQLRDAPSLRFPKPVAELRMGPVWLAQDIEQWEEGWERKPGRPRTEAEDDG